MTTALDILRDALARRRAFIALRRADAGADVTDTDTAVVATAGANGGLAVEFAAGAAADSGLATAAKQDEARAAIDLIKPASSGPVVDYSGGDVTYAGGVQLFVVTAGTIKYDDANGNLAQAPAGDFAAGVTTPWLVTKVYQTGTSAVLVAVS